MINRIDIELDSVSNIYDEYSLTDEVVEILLKLIDEGESQEAIDDFIQHYIVDPSVLYSDEIRRYIELSSTGIMTVKDSNKMVRNAALLSLGLSLFV